MDSELKKPILPEPQVLKLIAFQKLILVLKRILMDLKHEQITAFIFQCLKLGKMDAKTLQKFGISSVVFFDSEAPKNLVAIYASKIFILHVLDAVMK